MENKRKKYAVCGLLNISGLDIKTTLEQSDSLENLYDNINKFMNRAPILSSEIKEMRMTTQLHIIALKEKLNELKLISMNIGSLDVQFIIMQLEKFMNNDKERKLLLDELVKKISSLVEELEECKQLVLPQHLDNDEKLSDAIDKVYNNTTTNILVVDDSTPILNSVTAIIKQYYNVFGLPRAELVAKFLKTNKIDLFIIDIEMPGMDGYALFKSIRKMPMYQNVPIMFFTTHANKEYVTTAIDLGAADFIVKPVNKDLLISKVQKCLKK